MIYPLRTRHTTLIFMFFISLSFPSIAQYKGLFHGYLLNQKGQPLSNIQVEAPNHPVVKTDAAGHFLLNFRESIQELPLLVSVGGQYSLIANKSYQALSKNTLLIEGEGLKKGVIKIFLSDKNASLKTTTAQGTIIPIETKESIVATQSTTITALHGGHEDVGGKYVSKKKKTLHLQESPSVQESIVIQEIPVIIQEAEKPKEEVIAPPVVTRAPEPVAAVVPQPQIVQPQVIQQPVAAQPQYIPISYAAPAPQQVVYYQQQPYIYQQPVNYAPPVGYTLVPVQGGYIQQQPAQTIISQPQIYPPTTQLVPATQVVQPAAPVQQIVETPTPPQPQSVQKMEEPLVNTAQVEMKNEGLSTPFIPQPRFIETETPTHTEKITLYEVQIACMSLNNKSFSKEYYENLLQEEVNIRERSGRTVYTVSAKDKEDAKSKVRAWDNAKYDNLGIHDPFILTIEQETTSK